MPVNREACSLLAETIGLLVGELADEPAEVPHRGMVLREAEYLARKAWTRASIAGHIAVKYGGAGRGGGGTGGAGAGAGAGAKRGSGGAPGAGRTRTRTRNRLGAAGRPAASKRKAVELDENGWVKAPEETQ